MAELDFSSLPDKKSDELDFSSLPDKQTLPEQVAGNVGAFVRGSRQGSMAGWADELYGLGAASGMPNVVGEQVPGFLKPLYESVAKPAIGGARLGYEYLTGKPGSATESYNQKVQEEREADRLAQKNYPAANLTGNVIGAVTSPFGKVGAAETMLGRAAQAGLAGGLYGAASGAGEADGGLGERAKAAIVPGAVGAVTGGVGSPVFETLLKRGSQIVSAARGAINPEKEAARQIIAGNEAAQRSGAAMAAEDVAAAQQRNQPLIVADVMGEPGQSMARAASNISPEARVALKTAVDERAAERGARTADFMSTLLHPGGVNAARTADELLEKSQQSVSPYYQRAMKEGESGLLNDDLITIAQTPAGQRATADAVKMIQNQIPTKRGMSPLSQEGTPTLYFWDQFKRALDQQVNESYRKGVTPSDILDLRSTLVNNLDAAFPSYSDARGIASVFKRSGNALELGKELAAQRILDNSQLKKNLAKATEEEKDLMAIGFASHWANIAEKRPGAVNDLFKSRPAMERANLILGPENTKSLEAFLRVENLMNATKNEVIGNSSTARQLIQAGIMGGVGNEFISGDWNWQNFLTGAGLGAGRKFATKAVTSQINQNVAKHIGQLLASGDLSKIQQASKMISKNPRMMNNLREAEQAVARVLGAGAAQITKQHNVSVIPAEQGPPPTNTQLAAQ